MSRVISTAIDPELDAALVVYMQERGITQSQAVRNLLRTALDVCNVEESGFREGYTAAQREIRELIGRNIGQVIGEQ